MLNQYETVFIVTPVLSEAQMKEAVEKFRGVIVARGGEIINEENWGLRKLAYPYRKNQPAFLR
jgi:small subunit ribosomal protein S6